MGALIFMAGAMVIGIDLTVRYYAVRQELKTPYGD